MYLRIKDVLKEQNVTAKELAERVGISRENMTYIINEKSRPSFDTLVKISEAINVPLSELFSDSQKTSFVCPNCGAKLELKKVE